MVRIIGKLLVGQHPLAKQWRHNCYTTQDTVYLSVFPKALLQQAGKQQENYSLKQ
jgi:hypothetical protein